MRFAIKLGIVFALYPVAISAVEVREDLSFVKGRYATEADCATLQAFEKKGQAVSLENSAWHLTATGFSDGWENSCQFHAIFERDTSATVQAVCVAGAEVWPKLFYLAADDSGEQLPAIWVHEDTPGNEDGRQGVEYRACPRG